ncbi:hypothetical protein AgCh_033694 [Apium graveolens]
MSSKVDKELGLSLIWAGETMHETIMKAKSRDMAGRGFWNFNYDSSDEDDDSNYDSDFSDLDIPVGGPLTLYPGPDFEHYRHRHAHLRDFSKTAIQQYNHRTGNRFEFVELVNATVHTIVEYALIVVVFDACQTDDDGTVLTTSFRATARCHSPSKSLTDSYDIEDVVRLPSDSDVSGSQNPQ